VDAIWGSKMSEALLAKDIESFLADHRGIANAIPRHELLAHLHALGHSTTDRTMRRVYAELPQMGHCARGVFLIVSPADRKVTERDLHSRAMSELVRERRVKDAGPDDQAELPF
jgi:hypothetical protein